MCRELGVIHPDHLLDQLTSNQLSEWEAYNKLDPIGTWRSDYRMAYLTHVLINITRKLYGRKGIEMSKPLDFMPIWDEEEAKELQQPKKQTVQEMKEIIYAIAGAFKAKPKQRKS